MPPGNTTKARDILANIDSLVPGLVFVRLRRIGVEVRGQSLDRAEALYQDSVASAQGAEARNFYSWRYARFAAKVRWGSLGQRLFTAAICWDRTGLAVINLSLYPPPSVARRPQQGSAGAPRGPGAGPGQPHPLPAAAGGRDIAPAAQRGGGRGRL